MKKKIAAVTASLLLCLTCTAPVQPVCAAGETEPIACLSEDGFNTYCHNYLIRSGVTFSDLVPLEDGGWMRVQIFDTRADPVHVEYYDADFRLTKSFFVPKLMPDYGGFYHASDGYYYLITGDSKTSRAGESVKFDIAKYSTDWKLLAHVQTTGDDVTEAFYAGTVRCADDGKRMIIHTARKMQSGHQSNYSMELDMENMKLTYDDGGRAYTSHSFNQFVLLDQDDIVMLNHGDGYPRAVVLNRLSSSGRNGSVYMAEYGDPKDADLDDMRILNYTGAAVGGFVQSSTHYIMAYNEINPDLWYDLAVSQTFRESETARNIMIAAVPKDDLTQENVVRTAVTDYPDDGVSGGNPFLVPVGNDRFLLLWQHGEKVHYVFTDGTGALSGEQYELEGCLSDCEPVVSGGKLYWYTWEQSDIRFYSIDLEHPEQTDSVKRKAAHEMAQTEQDAAGNVYDVCTKCGLRVPHDDPYGYQPLLFRISRSDDRWERTLFRPETEYLEAGDEIALRIDKFNIDEERFFRMFLRGEAELPFDYDTWLYTVSEFDAPAVVFEIQLEPDMHRNRIQNVRFMAKHNYEFVSMQQADGDTAGSITLKCADCGHTASFAADALSSKKDAAVRAAPENVDPAAPAVAVTLTDPETGEETEAEQGNDFTAAYVKDPDTGQSYTVIVAAKDSGKLRGSAVIPFDGTQPERPAGDVNADGKFDSADAVLLQQWLLNIPDTELKDWKAADLSADNLLDAHDLSMMKMVLMQ